MIYKEIIGLITTHNTNDNFINLVVKDSNETSYNIKCNKEIFDALKLNHVYIFNVEVKEDKRTTYYLKEVTDVSFINSKRRDTILREYLKHQDLSYDDSKDIILSYISQIDNVALKRITSELFEENLVDFLTYPGGAKIHHAFLGGLAYHTIGMLKLASAFLTIYPYLNKDYLFSGIILHDLGKIYEYTDVQNAEFDIRGNMLGHLVMGAMEVEKKATELGYNGLEEVLILEHILVSHHGQLQFGAAKRPITAEALLIWYIDTIDSKFEELGTALENTKPGTFTDTMLVLDKIKIYKPKQ